MWMGGRRQHCAPVGVGTASTKARHERVGNACWAGLGIEGESTDLGVRREWRPKPISDLNAGDRRSSTHWIGEPTAMNALLYLFGSCGGHAIGLRRVQQRRSKARPTPLAPDPGTTCELLHPTLLRRIAPLPSLCFTPRHRDDVQQCCQDVSVTKLGQPSPRRSPRPPLPPIDMQRPLCGAM